MESSNAKKLVVIGGGAAGFFCAINAARLNPSLQVTIVEKSSKLLSKVRVSGGGRCNVTHACFEIAPLVKRYPRGTKFLKKTFHQFNTVHTVEWFEQRGVKLKTEEDGRMFSITNSSQTIIDCLLKEANKFGVDVLLNRDVKQIENAGAGFKLRFANSEELKADSVVVATGGFPKSSMFDWFKALGHTIEEPVPSLFTFNMPNNPITQLMGVSVEHAKVKVIGTKLEDEGPLLITHWGMSGPAILKLSAWGARELANKNYHFTMTVNWTGSFNEQSVRERWPQIRQQHNLQKISNRNPFNLPARLWNYLLQQSDVAEDIRWADLGAKEQNKLIKNLVAQEFEVKGKTTFKEEFVTCGGIKLSEVDANTMQSKLVPNLYFAGEVMDVDGVTGGFNFQHAWTSGWIAAKAVAKNTL
ncbi:MAG: NAD(P)/FAD-dependent oxidoreductase [Segetibacter sp.]|nr:NAD(P)/FAD-dependent oxidoreductase [Segetibacter sp.]